MAGHLDPGAEEFHPASQPPLAQIYYPYPLQPPPLQYVGAAATRAVVLSMVPRQAAEGVVRQAMEAFGGVRAVEAESVRAEGVATVHFFDLRSAEAAVAAVRDQHVRHQSRLSHPYAVAWPAPPPPPWGWHSHEAEHGGGARGLIAGQAVWAQFGATPLDSRNQGSLLVLNSAGLSPADLAHVFQTFGAVKEVREVPSRHRHKIVEFYDVRDAARALTELNRKEVLGRRLSMEFCSAGGQTTSYQKRSCESFRVPPRLLGSDRQPRAIEGVTLLRKSGSEKKESSSTSGGAGRRSKSSNMSSGGSNYASPSSSGSVKQRKGWRHHAKSVGGEARFVFKEAAAEADDSSSPTAKDSRTTVMIKNIPNKYSRTLLLNMLDNHCIHCNEKIGEGGEEPLSAYDFVYLPIDFNNKCNVGYGFVNFTSPEATWRLYNAFHMQPWEVFNSRKICQVTYARLQGLEALKEHFRNSKFACDNDEYMPVLFSPPRDGRQLTDPVAVGGRGPVAAGRWVADLARMRRGRGRDAAPPPADGGGASSTTTSTHAPSDHADGGEDDDDVGGGDGDDGGGESSSRLSESLMLLSYSQD